MRLGGNRNWLYLTRRALTLAGVSLLVVAASASAATRYAVPTGGLASGACTTGAECTLKYAIEGAGAGDTVWAAAGNYNVNAPISGGNITVRPLTSGVVIRGAANLSAPTI